MSGLGHETTKVCRKGYIWIASSSHELYDTLMNNRNCFISQLASQTLFTFECLQFLMNRWLVCVSKKRSQSSHLNCFFFSWIPYMCVSCQAKPLFVEKLAKQILYWCDFFPSWPDLMLLFVKISQHKVHIRMTSFSHNGLKLLFMIDSSTAFFRKVCITDFTF